MARVTGLEPATSGVTGRHSNHLSYTRVPRAAHRLGTAASYGPEGTVSRKNASAIPNGGIAYPLGQAQRVGSATA